MVAKDNWKYPRVDSPSLGEVTLGLGSLSHAKVDLGSVDSSQQCLRVPGEALVQ